MNNVSLVLSSILNIYTSLKIMDFLLGNNIFNAFKPKNYKVVLTIIINSIILIVLFQNVQLLVRGLLAVVLLIASYRILFVESIYKISFATVFAYLTVCFSEVILSITIVISKFDPTIIEKYFAGHLITNVFICCIAVLIGYKIKDKIIEILINNRKMETISIIIIMTITFIILVKFALENFLSVDFSNDYLINVGLIVFFVILTYMIIREKSLTSKINNDYQMLADYVETFEEVLGDYKKRRHENNNEWAVVYAMYQNEDERLDEYLKKLVKNKKTTHNYMWVESINRVPLSGLKGLLHYKLAKAIDAGLNISVYVDYKLEGLVFKHLDMNDYDYLFKMTGVYLDNAIEGSMLSEEKTLDVDITNEENKVKIEISNSYDNKVGKIVDKGPDRGYGLKLVKDLSKGITKIKSETSIGETFYSKTIYIYKEQKEK